MKKNMVIVALIVGFVSSQSSIAMDKLSFNSRNFVENSKKQGMSSYFAQGNLRDEWILAAIDNILGGSPVRQTNKNDVINKLIVMADILVGEPLRKNKNIDDAQYAAIIRNIENKIRFTVELKAAGR